MNAPYPLKAKPYWALNINLAIEKEEIQNIPGLFINARESRAEGLIDAIAAAANRLSRNIPPPPAAVPIEPTSIPLHPYQREGVGLLNEISKQTGSVLLADDMGLGKTRQVIAFAAAKHGRAFIVCPAFVRESWRAELSRLDEVSTAILGPQALKADKAEWEKAAEARWVVTSYHHGMMEKAYAAAFPASPPTIFIMDEAHRLRGREAKRFKIAKEIAALSDYRVMTTGSPIWSRPRDLYALLAILFGKRFGSQYQFDAAYCGGMQGEYGWTNKGATRAEELKLRLSYYMVRREKKDVAHELPSLSRQVIWCDPDKKAEQAFHRALLTKDPAATHEALLATHEAKIEAALELATQAKRFLLLTYRKSIAHQMSVMLNDAGTPNVCITGEMPTVARQAAVVNARHAGIGIVATIDSVFEGVDGIQHVADIGIMHALDYVPLKMAQAEARLHRLGQLNPVHWYYLACRNSMDSLVVRTIVDKLDANRAVMGQHVGRELRDNLSDSAGFEGEGQAAALKALYESF